MNDTIRALEAAITQTEEALQEKQVLLADLQLKLQQAKRDAWIPGRVVIITGETGNVLAEGRILQVNGAIKEGEGKYGLVTKEGEIRLWSEQTIRNLNVEYR